MSRLLAQMESTAGRFSGALESRRALFLIGFSLLYFPGTIWLASIKQLWSDELSTFYLSKQASLGSTWAALRMGVDNQPPPFFLITRVAAGLGIDPQVSVRLPEIIGFWVMSLFLFWYVARRTGALYGAVAMAGPFLCNAYFYACEARPYALVLAFCAMSLFSWQSACDGRRRLPALFALALVVAGLLSSSYYAFLVVAALAAAELARTVCRRRIDWPVWLSVGTGSSVLCLYLPFVRGSLNYFSVDTWASPGRQSLISAYTSLVGYSALPLLAVLILVSGYMLIASGSPSLPRTAGPAREVPPQEVAAGLALLLLPAAGYVAAVAVSNAFAPRYFLAAVIGFSVLVAYAGYRWTESSPLFGAAWLAVALVAFLVGGVYSGAKEYRARAASTYALRPLLAGQPGSLPVAMDDPLTAFSMFHYEKPDITSRLFFVVDPEASVRFGRIPYPEGKSWLTRRKIYPVHAEELAVFRRTWKQFLLYSTDSGLSYLLPKLLADGLEVRAVAARGAYKLYLVQEHAEVR